MGITETYYSRTRHEMHRFLPERYDRVLEIGCGEGSFSAGLNSAAERWGVEPNPVAGAKANGVLAKVLIGTYEQISHELPEAYFDLVICNDVIEHMTDHDAFLKAIKTKLKPGGTLVASVPNARYYRFLIELLVKKDWKYEDQGLFDRTHLRFFTQKSLRRSLEENGFSVKKFQGINSALPKPASLLVLHKSLPLLAILILTLGYYRDIFFVQFGFAAES